MSSEEQSAPDSLGALGWEEPTDWPEDARRDRLIGDWYLYQREGGHRTSTDDVVTAWMAVRAAAGAPQRYLDLGCGIGSVLLMAAHRLRPSVAVGVEAQPQSVLMARRTIAELPGQVGHIQVVHGDFRDHAIESGSFDLVTGSPPYFPLSAGVLPEDSQRRACRFEARGGIEAYCDAASRALTDTGRFAVVFQTAWDARVLAAATKAGLALWTRADLVMRVGRNQPFLTVYEFRKAAAPRVETLGFAIRTADGAISAEYLAARRLLGVESEFRAAD